MENNFSGQNIYWQRDLKLIILEQLNKDHCVQLFFHNNWRKKTQTTISYFAGCFPHNMVIVV